MSAAKLPAPGSVQRTYLVLLLGNTLAASLIWGINTIFLLDAGLSNLEAFAANAFFTAGMVIFEVPTGVVADTVGRRASYLLGTVTLAASTLLYVLLWRIHAPFWQWAVVSMLIGLGFTFFSGAVEAWLGGALKATLFTGGVGIYGFYALQPYLLKLYGDPHAYLIAGLAAAIVASAQILGGIAAPRIRRLFSRRTSALIATATVGVVVLGLMGILQNFWIVIGLVIIWSLIFAASMPIRQTYMNGMIPSRQRATILSFDSLMWSTGGVWAQPLLGRVADVWGYGPSYLVGAAISALAIPCLALPRRRIAPAAPVQPASTSCGPTTTESQTIA